MTATAKKPARAKAPAVHYPNLPITDPAGPWDLAWYLRKVAELEALIQAKEETSTKILYMALADAVHNHRKEITETLGYVIQDGMLLFAFPGTTALTQEVAR